MPDAFFAVDVVVCCKARSPALDGDRSGHGGVAIAGDVDPATAIIDTAIR
jgi:hypothetical protein